MKKVLFIFFVTGLIVSCTNVKESKEYKELEAERDSLIVQSAEADVEAAEMMSVISEVEANFEKIREAEKYITTESVQPGEMSKDTKDRVADNFRMINEILKRNKIQLNELNKKLGSSSKEVVSLKNTISRLNREMQESVDRMVEMQKLIEKRDEQIQQLSQDIVSLADEAEQQSITIQEQDKTLHRAYYVFGTAHELKNQKILSGGFLQTTRVMKETFNKEFFLQIDIRDVTEIPVYAPKAKLWSNHPEGTYQFKKGEDGKLTLYITDNQRFWSLTKYLIIEVY